MMQEPKFSQADLIPHWILLVFFLLFLIGYNLICYGWGNEIQINFEAADRQLLKGVLYAITILLFPLVKLLRYILLRLNQTMPLDNKHAYQRYFFTVALTMTVIEIVGMFGFLLFILGDGYNTLSIFSVLAALGLFLHKPDLQEYLRICEALHTKSQST
ncbi:hypothetical protein [Methylomonas sp. AM2-LC]|uniref:hypothetical protein n=1 Tax=Methylomonas sp. AM2-LC TaxID=3153301 RepID=UPI0032645413